MFSQYLWENSAGSYAVCSFPLAKWLSVLPYHFFHELWCQKIVVGIFCNRGNMIHWNSIISQYVFWRYRYCIVGLVSRYLMIHTKVQFQKKNDSFNIFQDHFYNKLQRSKMLLKYTDHLYGKQGHLTQALLHKNEPQRWFWACFPRVLKFSNCDMYKNSIAIRILSWGKHHNMYHIVR